MASDPSNSTPNKDQQHPQYVSDRDIANSLAAGEPSDYNLAELARLRIRYRGFPGARDIQADLDNILKQWKLTEDELFQKTRQIHQTSKIYKGRTNQREDWS